MDDPKRTSSEWEEMQAEVDGQVAERVENDRRGALKEKLALYLQEFPTALILSVMTAVVTLLLATLLSVLLGAENRQHREASRCGQALIVNMLREAYRVNPDYESISDRYHSINVEGIDCTQYLLQPLEPGGHN